MCINLSEVGGEGVGVRCRLRHDYCLLHETEDQRSSEVTGDLSHLLSFYKLKQIIDWKSHFIKLYDPSINDHLNLESDSWKDCILLGDVLCSLLPTFTGERNLHLPETTWRDLIVCSVVSRLRKYIKIVYIVIVSTRLVLHVQDYCNLVIMDHYYRYF